MILFFLLISLIGLPFKSVYAIFISLLFFFGIPFGIYFCLTFNSISFLLDENSISINSGILFKHSFSIAYNNVQNVDCTSGPLSGLFNLSTIKIWTAASSQIIIGRGNSNNEPDGLLTLKSEEAVWLKNFIINKHPIQQ
jgi:membrane protein YdbS with pleckstrin-like domain